MVRPNVWAGMYRALVQRAGGVDVVAAVHEAHFGHGSKGTVSKMTSGQAAVTLDAVEALEGFLGEYPITTRLFERVEREASRLDLPQLAARSAMVAGAAHAALIASLSEFSEGGARLSEAERVAVLVEVRALKEVVDQIIAAAEAAA